MQKAYDNGLDLARKLGWTIIHCTDIRGNVKHIEDIHKEIMDIATEFLKNHKTQETEE